MTGYHPTLHVSRTGKHNSRQAVEKIICRHVSVTDLHIISQRKSSSHLCPKCFVNKPSLHMKNRSDKTVQNVKLSKNNLYRIRKQNTWVISRNFAAILKNQGLYVTNPCPVRRLVYVVLMVLLDLVWNYQRVTNSASRVAAALALG